MSSALRKLPTGQVTSWGRWLVRGSVTLSALETTGLNGNWVDFSTEVKKKNKKVFAWCSELLESSKYCMYLHKAFENSSTAKKISFRLKVLRGYGLRNQTSIN